RQRAAALETRRIGVGGGLRRRQRGDGVGERAEIIVAHPLHRFVHRREAALSLAEEINLDERVRGGLRAERRDLGRLRLSRLAVAGKARYELRRRRGRGRTRNRREQYRRRAGNAPAIE